MHLVRCFFCDSLLKVKFSRFRSLERFMITSEDIADMRKAYHGEENTFLESNLVSQDPMKQFNNWLEYACQYPGIQEPNAMTLATVKSNGRPAARMVLLKGFDERGFKFYTNYKSAKAKQLETTPFAALVFHWVEISRSIRIEGEIEKLPTEDSDKYFGTRPRPSQIAAHVSANQSAPVKSRDVLKKREIELEAQYQSDSSVPRPEYWGGYLLKPDMIEFWQGQKNRMHDRIVFRKKENVSGDFVHEADNGWVFQRLEP